PRFAGASLGALPRAHLPPGDRREAGRGANPEPMGRRGQGDRSALRLARDPGAVAPARGGERVIPVIARLVDDLERRWKAKNYEEACCSSIACGALEEARLCESLGFADIIRWFNQERPWAPQANLEGSFGEPPLTLGFNARFYVEALLWVDGT